ncbi:MAG: hypothetical protein HRF45_02910 [Fimbriimonadia bacterium]|jgi:hypothetical protein
MAFSRLRAAALTAFALALAGCGKPPEPTVYVNLDRVWEVRAFKPEGAVTALHEFRVPQEKVEHNVRKQFVLEPLTTTPGFREELEARRKLALDITARLRLEVEQELRDAASLRIARDVERKKADLVQEADAEAGAAYDRLRLRLRELAEAYAERKARLLVRRAVLSAEGGSSPRPDLVREELRTVVAELERLDAEQDAQVRSLQQEAEATAASARRNVQVLADEYAQKRVREELVVIEQKLSGESFDLRLVLPDAPLTPEVSTLREVLVLDAVPIPDLPARRGADTAARWAAGERESLLRQARLWARAKGWRLSDTPRGARDVTADFLKEFAP